MSELKASSSIIICGEPQPVDGTVFTFRDNPSISAYTPRCVHFDQVSPVKPARGREGAVSRYRARRLMGADTSLSRLRQVVRQFVVHHDGMGTSLDCFRVLHDDRGLSVHFLIDNNGDIYQTLDVLDCGFQAAGVNEISIGVELCSRGDRLDLNAEQKAIYDRHKREPVTCTINGHQWLSWDYSREQYEAMIALGKLLARHLPGLPQCFPSDGGELARATLADARLYSGYLGHFHVTNQKWDPGPFDFKRFVQAIRTRAFYPAVPRRQSPEVPGDPVEDQAVLQSVYDNNEIEGAGGYFPVGPYGTTRLWHGGLHLRQDPGRPIAAPFAGRIVLARFEAEDDWPPNGSPNFVLIRHDMNVAGADLRFFTLFMHVAALEEATPPWLEQSGERAFVGELRAGQVVRPDVPIGAGDTVAFFGEAGRRKTWEGQVHVEIFAADEIGARVEPGFWTTLDGSRDGRFCQRPEIVGPIDHNPRDGLLGNREVPDFFQRNPARQAFRRYAVRHVSEWGDRGDFEQALRVSPDYRRLTAVEQRRFFTDQLERFFFWDDDLSVPLGLPEDKVIWGYHPITFIHWLNEKLNRPAADAAIEDGRAFRGTRPPAGIKDDATEGADGFVDDEDLLYGDASRTLDLEALARGYPER